MVFTDSSAPDLTESIPTPLSRRITATAAYVQGGCQFDVAIGGLPFMYAISDQHPYQRQTADFRKQQLDTSKEPGEQSLDQWWVRDQASWHHGAGINFYEPGSDTATQYRFHSSAGVDVWTQGQVSLLKSMTLTGAVAASQVAYATTARVGGEDVFFTNENGTVKRRDASTSTSYTGAAPTTRVVVAGAKILAGISTKIVSGDATGSTLADLWTGATGTPVPYWVKGRIVAVTGTSLWDLTLAGGTWPATALHTHPDTGWTWTAVAEAPTAILAAGYGANGGAIYRFALEDAGSGTTPTLGQAYQVAEFPPGEEVHSLRVYLGTYVGIGTSRGVRVGLLAEDGSIQQGPIIFPTTNPVRSLTARDTFIYAAVEEGIDGFSGAVRINLAEPVDDSGLRFAYATDAQTHDTGRVDSIAFLGNSDRVVLGVYGKGVYLQSDVDFEADGYVRSGAMRYATTEPKAFRRVKIRAGTNGGTVWLYAVDRAENETYVFTLGDDYNTDSDIGLPNSNTPQPYMSFRLRLVSSGDASTSPVLEGLQVKALPQVKRQRLIQMPLMCMDREQDRNGIKTGYEGGAADRLFALEGLEDLQAVVPVEDFTSGESFQAQIESVQVEGSTPPSRRGGNFGGLITVVVRKI